MLFKFFFETQCEYCPLIWLFCSRSGNIKINKLHEKALRIVYDDNKSRFEELLTKYDSLTTSPKHSELEIEMFKIHYGFSQVSFLGLFHTVMKMTLIVYDLNPTFKFQELAPLLKEQSLYDILDQ